MPPTWRAAWLPRSCFDHVTFDGIVVPTFRRVVKRRNFCEYHGPWSNRSADSDQRCFAELR